MKGIMRVYDKDRDLDFQYALLQDRVYVQIKNRFGTVVQRGLIQ